MGPCPVMWPILIKGGALCLTRCPLRLEQMLLLLLNLQLLFRTVDGTDVVTRRTAVKCSRELAQGVALLAPLYCAVSIRRSGGYVVCAVGDPVHRLVTWYGELWGNCRIFVL